MTPEQIHFVRSSWQQIEPIGSQAATLFYQRLFEIDPSLRSMFKPDIEAQSEKLFAIINTVVRSLDKIETMLPAVRALGRRHANYGVKTEHYDTVGKALIWTLDQGLGNAFTTEVERAWTALYQTLASTMQIAAAEIKAAA